MALVFSTALMAAPQNISIRWAADAPSGEITVVHGTLASLKATGGDTPTATAFRFGQHRAGQLDLAIDATNDPAAATLVSVTGTQRGFTFRTIDVNEACPIYLPGDNVIVTTAADRRSFDAIVKAIRAKNSQTKLQQIAAEPEESFANASVNTRENKVQTWLGLGRDDRLFRVDEHLDWIQPRLSGRELNLPEAGNSQITYDFQIGRGWGVRDDLHRKLDDDTLPILHATIDDDSIRYESTMFTTLERQPLIAANIRGTEYLVADLNSHGHMFTTAQKTALDAQMKIEEFPPEETVLRARVIATNRGTTPHFAFVRTPTPSAKAPPKWDFNSATGEASFSADRIFLGAKLNGQPLASSEVSQLLQPGESLVLEFFIPHRPLSRERAAAVAAQSFDTRLNECREYWRKELSTAASVHVPEPRIDAMVRAGLLHLDLVAYGRNPDGPLLPAIGVYTAIGSESSPIIQFMDSMGWHETAARSIDYFLAKQHDDGFMQNFNNYMLETGAVLWTMGEHYRYTQDDAWLRRVQPNVKRACDYLHAWRARNLQPELKNDGYGMLDGKTADPEDPYRSFMLNGYAYLGLSRAAEMYAVVAPQESAAWRAEAETLKTDIRASLEASFERTPVVPFGDGTWSRATAPWTRYRGPVMLHADGGRWFTHGSITARDSLLGPLYLVFQEVVSPDEPMGVELLQTHSELMTKRNVAFSQPYYSRHPWVHLRRAEPKAFLAAWYNTVAAMADRETYTFTEHLFPVSAHKTHEEAWFLMETRWMLYLEEGRTLRLLSGIPRAYLEPGKEISVKNAASYFGPLSFQVKSVDAGLIKATVDCSSPRHPDVIEIRVPHPTGAKPKSVDGGEFNAIRESVFVRNFTGHAEVTVRY